MRARGSTEGGVLVRNQYGVRNPNAVNGGEVPSDVRPRRPRLGARTKDPWRCVGVGEANALWC